MKLDDLKVETKKGSRLVRCAAVYFGRSVLTLQMNMLSTLSGQIIEIEGPFEMSARFYYATKYLILEDNKLLHVALPQLST